MSEADAAAGGSTKRQRRKQVNDSQKWPQHPKVQTSQARAKVYLKTSGLQTKNAKQKLNIDAPEVKIGRLLGGTCARTRHLAVLQLEQYLSQRASSAGWTYLDLLKLCKALWYTLYMADQVSVQQELCVILAKLIWAVSGSEEEDEYAGKAYLELCGEEEYDDEDDDDSDDVEMEEVANTLADADSDEEKQEEEDDSYEEHLKEVEEELIEEEQSEASDEQDDDDDDIPFDQQRHCRGVHLSALLLQAMLETIRREWGRMDKYRVDKFYSLLRCLQRQVFEYMAQRHWSEGIVQLFTDTIFEQVFKEPTGIRLHFVDIVLEELAQVSAKAPLPLTEVTFTDVLGPYFALARSADDEVLQRRVVEKVLLNFVDNYSVVSELPGEVVFEQVHVGSVAEFIFELASDGEECLDKYRKSLYDLHKHYQRQLKNGKDVDLDTLDLEQHEMENDESESSDQEGYASFGVDSGSADDVGEERLLNETNNRENIVDESFEAGSNGEDVDMLKLSKKERKRLKKEKRKAKRKARLDEQEEEIIETPTVDIVSEDVEPAVDSKKKKKRKKKKKSLEQEESMVGSEDEAKEEQEIVISVKEQKSAKRANQKSSQQKVSSGIITKEMLQRQIEKREERKRVKFGDVNGARSYQASMKGLLTKDPPHRKTEASPEQGILRNKHKHTPRSGSSNKKRRKATDYF